MIMDIREQLFSLQDLKYKEFHAGLIPTIDPDRIIGVRLPDLRALAKELSGTEEALRFMATLPHDYYDENTLHGILISNLKDPVVCLDALDAFLPYVDNWATCDVISPKVFKKNLACLLQRIPGWLDSEHIYTVRFGIRMLMNFYLDEAFQPEYLDWAAGISLDEYYVRMGIAWYFATALAKQPEAALPYITERRLDPWTHNKTIQKACESFRVTPEMKEKLKALRVDG